MFWRWFRHSDSPYLLHVVRPWPSRARERGVEPAADAGAGCLHNGSSASARSSDGAGTMHVAQHGSDALSATVCLL